MGGHGKEGTGIGWGGDGMVVQIGWGGRMRVGRGKMDSEEVGVRHIFIHLIHRHLGPEILRSIVVSIDSSIRRGYNSARPVAPCRLAQVHQAHHQLEWTTTIVST